MEESLARLSEKEIIKIDNSTVIANFELYPESLTSSILWMVDKFFEYLYQVTNESNQFEYEDITNQFEYEDVVNYLRIVHSDDDLPSLGKVLYRNSNAIMWILGHLLESKNKGKQYLPEIMLSIFRGWIILHQLGHNGQDTSLILGLMKVIIPLK